MQSFSRLALVVLEIIGGVGGGGGGGFNSKRPSLNRIKECVQNGSFQLNWYL